ncbi:MAG: deoxyribonuclease IV [Patescibacteria group bacterium]
MNTRRLGAHVSISKGLTEALVKARNMGGNCIQIFSSPPRGFAPPKFTNEKCKEFKEKSNELNIKPVFIHATYLVNLASEKESLMDASIKSLVDDLNFGDKIGAAGVIVHTGSHKGKGFHFALPIVTDSIRTILNQTHGNTKLLLEIASGGNGKIGSTFEELQKLLLSVKDKRLGVCLDTCHMFAGGYNFDTQEAVNVLLKKITEKVGWNVIDCIHINDSKFPVGSFRDRHENLGNGFIGIEGLKLLLNTPKFSELPMILETPGFDEKGPDKENLDILKNLIS